MENINVLIVEDDPMVVDIHKRYILSVEGFNVIGMVHKGNDALEFLDNHNVTLIILDIFMPEMDGIETLKKIREKRKDVDVILITAAKESNIIKSVLRCGAFDYIIKPFTFERFKASLESYKNHFRKIITGIDEYSQKEIDDLFISKLHHKQSNSLPKGLQLTTLQNIMLYLKEKQEALSADEVAQVVGVSRVTARRYLEYLVASGDAIMELSYQYVGRPVNKYKLLE